MRSILQDCSLHKHLWMDSPESKTMGAPAHKMCNIRRAPLRSASQWDTGSLGSTWKSGFSAEEKEWVAWCSGAQDIQATIFPHVMQAWAKRTHGHIFCHTAAWPEFRPGPGSLLSVCLHTAVSRQNRREVNCPGSVVRHPVLPLGDPKSQFPHL